MIFGNPSNAPIRPFELSLLYKDHQEKPDSLIIDNTSIATLKLRVKGEDTVHFNVKPGTSVSTNHFHFYLRIGRESLSSPLADLYKIKLNNDDWQIHIEETHKTYVYIYFLCTKASEVHKKNDKEQVFNFNLSDLIAKDDLNYHNSYIDIIFNDSVDFTYLQSGKSTDKVSASTWNEIGCEKPLSIVNINQKQVFPLTAQWIGLSNTIINDGNTKNTLVLRIFNAGTHALNFNKNASIDIFISSDEEMGLTSQKNIDGKGEISIEPLNQSGYSLQDNWKLSPQGFFNPSNICTLGTERADIIIEPQGFLDIRLDNIITNYISGTTHIILNYYDFVGFADGQIMVPLTKAPIQLKVDETVKCTRESNLLSVYGKTELDNNLTVNANTELQDLTVTATTKLQDLTVTANTELQDLTVTANTELQDLTVTANTELQDLTVNANTKLQYLTVTSTTELQNLNVNGEAELQSLTASNNINTTNGKIQENGYALLPRGVIVMWHGSFEDIPDGWALCDSNNGTPNLVNKFVAGAGGPNTPYADVGSDCPDEPKKNYQWGDRGGKKKVELKHDQMPSHYHEMDCVTTRSGTGNSDKCDIYKANSTAADSGKNTGAGTLDSGESKAHENIPPFYALCFIMKL